MKKNRSRGSSAGAIFFRKSSHTGKSLRKSPLSDHMLSCKVGQSLTGGLNIDPFEIFVPIDPKSENRIYGNQERITGFSTL